MLTARLLCCTRAASMLARTWLLHGGGEPPHGGDPMAESQWRDPAWRAWRRPTQIATPPHCHLPQAEGTRYWACMTLELSVGAFMLETSTARGAYGVPMHPGAHHHGQAELAADSALHRPRHYHRASSGPYLSPYTRVVCPSQWFIIQPGGVNSRSIVNLFCHMLVMCPPLLCFPSLFSCVTRDCWLSVVSVPHS